MSVNSEAEQLGLRLALEALGSCKCLLCSDSSQGYIVPYISFLFLHTVQASLGLKSQWWVHAFHIESPQMFLLKKT